MSDLPFVIVNPASRSGRTGREWPAIEAGLRQGWDAWLQPDGGFIGMAGFGASAPIGDLYPHFGITAEAVVEAVKARL